jgi:hypothetical protein
MECLKLYKHENNTDVVLCPLEKSWKRIDGEVYFILKAVWFNIVQCRVSGMEPMLIDHVDEVKIRAKDLGNWKYWGEVPKVNL